MEGICTRKNRDNYRKERSFPVNFVSIDDSFHTYMAQNYGFLVCILVMVMDAVAGLLAIRAEKAQNQVKLQSESLWVYECSRKPRDDAFSQGLAATILLGLAHAIAKVLGGCIWIRNMQHFQQSNANRRLGLLFMILSWITLAIGFSMLVAGTVDNSKRKNSCEISSHGLFLIGGIVCFIHGLCTVAYYVSATAAYREEERKSKEKPSVPQHV
ncbi:uncharacterized protein LOC111802580 [Cucurbita pepo subsp. pepo]|uniref:uncharacterized protein LOC111802580 n=1 Tax=Cucurbita pepo subsp. pepo TaxID=3664 RepID=UPI000C9D6DE2|nr:uncharacterized protein LOC111802580 [Cucurbita pepo subsp. pepo]